MPVIPISVALVIGVLLYGALYTAGLFIVGLWMGNKLIVLGAIATAGVTYLSFACQVMDGPRWLSVLLVYGSLVLGAATGLALIMEVI